MAINISILGKFKNGKTKVAEINISPDDKIRYEHLVKLNSKLKDNIYNNFEKFSTIIVKSSYHSDRIPNVYFEISNKVTSVAEIITEVNNGRTCINRLIETNEQ